MWQLKVFYFDRLERIMSPTPVQMLQDLRHFIFHQIWELIPILGGSPVWNIQLWSIKMLMALIRGLLIKVITFYLINDISGNLTFKPLFRSES
jgi:hypothetical protein